MKYLKLFEQDEWWLDGKNSNDKDFYSDDDDDDLSWVPVLQENRRHRRIYIPRQYPKHVLYNGPEALPNFKTETECQLWCDIINAIG